MIPMYFDEYDFDLDEKLPALSDPKAAEQYYKYAEDEQAKEDKYKKERECNLQTVLDNRFSSTESQDAVIATINALIKQAFGPQWRWRIQMITYVDRDRGILKPKFMYGAYLIATDESGILTKELMWERGLNICNTPWYDTIEHAWGWIIWRLEHFLYYRAVIAGLVPPIPPKTKEQPDCCPVVYVGKACVEQRRTPVARRLIRSRCAPSEIGYSQLVQLQHGRFGEAKAEEEGRAVILASSANTPGFTTSLVSVLGLTFTMERRKQEAARRTLRRRQKCVTMLQFHRVYKADSKNRRSRHWGMAMLKYHQECIHLRGYFKILEHMAKDKIQSFRAFGGNSFFHEVVRYGIRQGMVKGLWQRDKEPLTSFLERLNYVEKVEVRTMEVPDEELVETSEGGDHSTESDGEIADSPEEGDEWAKSGGWIDQRIPVKFEVNQRCKSI